jgi:hypothetical protein
MQLDSRRGLSATPLQLARARAPSFCETILHQRRREPAPSTHPSFFQLAPVKLKILSLLAKHPPELSVHRLALLQANPKLALVQAVVSLTEATERASKERVQQRRT